MADIKTKDTIKKTIKSIDKGIIATESFKDNIVNTKQKVEQYTSDNNDNNLSEEFTNQRNMMVKNINEINECGKKALIKSKQNIVKLKNTPKNIINTIKQTKKDIKTSREVLRKSKKATEESIKASQKAIKMTKDTAKVVAKTTKTIIEASVKIIKALYDALSSLIAFIFAGGWVAIIIIVIICMIGLLLGSGFGIFFMDDMNKEYTVSNLIYETNIEVNNIVELRKSIYKYDRVEVNVEFNRWNEILAIYAVKSNIDYDNNIYELNLNNRSVLKSMFWQMNKIESEVKIEKVSDFKYEKVLYNNLVSETLEEMMNKYLLTTEQKNKVNEILNIQ